MNKEELIAFLKENLSIECDKELGCFESDRLVIKLRLGHEEISKDSISLTELEK